MLKKITLTRIFLSSFLFVIVWTSSFAQTTLQSDSIKIVVAKGRVPVFTAGSEILTRNELINKLKEKEDFELNYYVKKYGTRRTLENVMAESGIALVGASLASQGLNDDLKIGFLMYCMLFDLFFDL